jgi:DNA-binding transcriptional MerR regulator
MFQIGELSKMGKTTVKTLRYYEETGLLKPEKVDGETGYRFYTTEQLILLHRILSLRQVGLSIAEIAIILSGGDEEEILDRRRSEIKSELREAKDQLSRIEFILSGREEEKMLEYQARIKELPECIVYCKTLTVPNYDAYFEVIPAIGEEVTQANPGLKCSVPEYSFIVYLDGEYRDQNMNIEYCEAVEDFGVETDTITFKKMEPVTAVSVLYKGPYSEISQAYAFAFQWIEENGYERTDNPRESYIDGIWNKESEDDWLTELQIPIAKKRGM